jgi:hypothetical protein
MTKDIKVIFTWAKERGDANIYDRILMKVLPELLEEKIQLTSESIESSDTIMVSDKLYNSILSNSEQLVGEKYV